MDHLRPLRPHMLSSQDGNRVKGTIIAGGRDRDILVYFILERGVHYEIKHYISFENVAIT